MCCFTRHLNHDTILKLKLIWGGERLRHNRSSLFTPFYFQVHAESLQQVVKSQREANEVLQEATCKIATHQADTARLTTDAARQICEVRPLKNPFLFSQSE